MSEKNKKFRIHLKTIGWEQGNKEDYLRDQTGKQIIELEEGGRSIPAITDRS